jgi:hypothetical protein
MLLVLNDAPEWRENEFCQWCSEQFMPAMRCVPGITEAWFYRAKVGGPAYLQVYYLSSLEVLLQPEYLRARGWGQSGNAAAQSMISKSPNLIVGVYEHISTAPSSASPDLGRVHALLLVSLDMNRPELKEEFEDWYRTEHIPNLGGSPGIQRAHRSGLVAHAADNQGDPMNYAALYAAESLDAYETEEWYRRVRTPWMLRLYKYYVGRLRNRYELICRAL